LTSQAKDLNVTYADGMLHIRGEKRREKEEKGERYYRVEREYGTFHRDFCLPEDVMADKVEAMYQDGVLKINLPRTEIETKKIEVKEEKAAKRETHVEVK
jgi:HSP20 family protein